jgi:hypothetical protein
MAPGYRNRTAAAHPLQETIDAMSPHPVRLVVEPSASRQRLHVLIRLAILVAICTIGGHSLGWIVYLLVPAAAALRISQAGAARYLADDGPRITLILRWFARAGGYLLLLTDAVPTSAATSEPSHPIEFEIAAGGAPSVGQAMLRLITSVPALLLVALLGLLAIPVWLVGALAILIAGHLPSLLADYLALTLRYKMRILAYHLSLVDRYPSFEVAPRIPTPATT